ncbi:MAG: hypothetical protein KKB65_01765 [Nanoarchaeota archaeon]|nr:hypothetical protein [Nanoarchaeota archaeon]
MVIKICKSKNNKNYFLYQNKPFFINESPRNLTHNPKGYDYFISNCSSYGVWFKSGYIDGFEVYLFGELFGVINSDGDIEVSE